MTRQTTRELAIAISGSSLGVALAFAVHGYLDVPLCLAVLAAAAAVAAAFLASLEGRDAD